MGQRSQIYIRNNNPKYGDKPILKAIYFQWNYGERMISRARTLVEWIVDYYFEHDYYVEMDKLFELAKINFDMQDCANVLDIIAEYKRYLPDYIKMNPNDVIFYDDNNDGKLFIDIDEKNKAVKYAFTDYDNTLKMNAREYIAWDLIGEHTGEWEEAIKKDYDYLDFLEYTRKNIEYIEENAELMTDYELKDYLSYDYGLKFTDEEIKTELLKICDMLLYKHYSLEPIKEINEYNYILTEIFKIIEFIRKKNYDMDNVYKCNYSATIAYLKAYIADEIRYKSGEEALAYIRNLDIIPYMEEE